MKWLRSYFERVWGWESGKEFVFLAPMNTMAARIDGSTIHSWGEIQWERDGPQGGFKLGGRRGQKGDMSSMAAKLQWCRFVLIDEIEAVGAEIIGQLQEHVAEATRTQWYKYRKGDRVRARPFGGLNSITSGDWWQLPHVKAASLYNNPFRSGYDHLEQRALGFFWRR